MFHAILGTYPMNYWLFIWSSDVTVHPVFYLTTLIIPCLWCSVNTYMNEEVNRAHAYQKQKTKCRYFTGNTQEHFRGDYFKVIGLLQIFCFSMWFCILFNLTDMSRKGFKYHICIYTYISMHYLKQNKPAYKRHNLCFPSAWNLEFSEHIPVVRDIFGIHKIIESNIEKYIRHISKLEHTKRYKEFKKYCYFF